MSYHCSLALVEAFSDQDCLDGEQCAALKSIRTAERSYFDAKKKGSLNRFPSGTTSEHSTATLGVIRWMSSLEDSHVNPSQPPEKETEKKMSATSGLTVSGRFAKWDPNGRIWRTFQGSLAFEGETTGLTTGEYSETWPRAGMMVDGVCYRQPSAERRISGIGSGLWYTPEAKNQEGYQVVGGKKYPRLGAQAKMWPTPRTITGGAESAERKQELGRTESGGGDLQAAVKSWPTPRVTTSGMVPSKAQLARIRAGEEAERGKGACKLEISVALHGGESTRQMPHDWTKENKDLERMATQQLNPDWVEWLMGWPIGWTALKPLETDRFRKWLELHGIS